MLAVESSPVEWCINGVLEGLGLDLLETRGEMNSFSLSSSSSDKDTEGNWVLGELLNALLVTNMSRVALCKLSINWFEELRTDSPWWCVASIAALFNAALLISASLAERHEFSYREGAYVGLARAPLWLALRLPPPIDSSFASPRREAALLYELSKLLSRNAGLQKLLFLVLEEHSCASSETLLRFGHCTGDASSTK